MQEGASVTAKNVALLRAAQQLLEGGAIFANRFALPICGEAEDAVLSFMRQHPEFERLRLLSQSAVALPRSVWQALSQAACAKSWCWVRGLIALGCAIRAQGLSVFEVDRPATQRWKLDCLRKTDLERPAWLRFVAVDFETQPRLVPAGHGLIAAWPGAKGGCNDRRSRERKGKAC